MITIIDIQKAVSMMIHPIEYLNCEALHKQLVLSLEVYEYRGEFNPESDAAIEDAKNCLEMACYEIEVINDGSWCGFSASGKSEDQQEA